jgi:hypothetical protein
MDPVKGALTSEWNYSQLVNNNLYERHQRWKTIFENGGGSPTDLISADFGTTCPNGLETTPWNHAQDITIKSPFETQGYQDHKDTPQELFSQALVTSTGWVPSNNPNEIVFNNFLGHENTLKVLDGSQDPGIYRTLETERDFYFTAEDTLSHEFAHTQSVGLICSGWKKQQMSMDFYETGQKERGLLQKMWEKHKRPKLDRHPQFDEMPEDIKIKHSFVSGYLGGNEEIQARMHQLMAIGYAHWDTLPTTKIELWASLRNFGLEPPRSVKREMRSPEGRVALAQFKLHDKFKSQYEPIVRDLEQVQNFAGYTDILNGFWNEKYPLLYGELTEFYGDKLGRERMGMGPNPRDAIEAFLDLGDFDGSVITQDQADTIAAGVPENLSVTFINNLSFKYGDDNESQQNALKVCNALLQRPGIQEALFADNQTASRQLGHTSCQPLYVAIGVGNLAVTKMLLESGADPFQAFEEVDIRGKTVEMTTPLSFVVDLEGREAKLNDESLVPERQRANYENPAIRAKMVDSIEKTKDALKLMLETSDTPHEERTLILEDGSTITTSLAAYLEKLDITLDAPDASTASHHINQSTSASADTGSM